MTRPWPEPIFKVMHEFANWTESNAFFEQHFCFVFVLNEEEGKFSFKLRAMLDNFNSSITFHINKTCVASHSCCSFLLLLVRFAASYAVFMFSCFWCSLWVKKNIFGNFHFDCWHYTLPYTAMNLNPFIIESAFPFIDDATEIKWQHVCVHRNSLSLVTREMREMTYNFIFTATITIPAIECPYEE